MKKRGREEGRLYGLNPNFSLSVKTNIGKFF